MDQPTLREKIFNKLVNYKFNFHLRLYFIIDSFFIKNNHAPKNFNQLLFSYIAFGEKYIDALLEFSLPSILQENNIPLIVKNSYKVIIKISVKSNSEKEKILNHSIYKKLIQFSKVEIICQDEKGRLNNGDWFFKYYTMYNSLKFSLDNNTPLFWVAPDDFYSDGSLSNILELSRSNNDFFLFQHARVKWNSTLNLIKSKFKSDPNYTISSRELVQIGIKNLISVQKQSIEQNDNLGTKGLNIKQINKNTYAVTASRPAPIFGGILNSDLSFFRKFSHFNYNDFLWPRKLIKDGRAKFICDSDIFFKIELSDESNYKVEKVSNEEIHKNPYGGKHRLLNHKISEATIFFWKI